MASRIGAMQGQNEGPNGKNSVKAEKIDIRFNGFKMERKSGLKSAVNQTQLESACNCSAASHRVLLAVPCTRPVRASVSLSR